MNNNTIQNAKSKTKKLNLPYFSIAISTATIVVMILILVSPVKYAISVVDGLKLFFSSVLPGLLPFMFFTRILTNSGIIAKIVRPLEKTSQKAFGIGANGVYAFIMSIISGYPIGSKITADLYESGQINDNELMKTALISSTSGPIFVIGAVGGSMLKSVKLGAIIYVSNLIAVIITALLINSCTRRKSKVKVSQTDTIKIEKKTLYALAKDTVISTLIVGFYVALFSLFIKLLTELKVIAFLSSMLDTILGKSASSSGLSQGIMSGIIEMTNGAKMLSVTPSPLFISSIAFIIGFSGISIIMQSLSFLSKTKIKPTTFVIGKVFHGILSFIICYLFLL